MAIVRRSGSCVHSYSYCAKTRPQESRDSGVPRVQTSNLEQKMEDKPILEDMLGPEKGGASSSSAAAAAAAQGTPPSKKPIVMLVIGKFCF